MTKYPIHNLPMTIADTMYKYGITLADLLIIADMDRQCKVNGFAVIPEVLLNVPMNNDIIYLQVRKLVKGGYLAKGKMRKNNWTPDNYEVTTLGSLVLSSGNRALRR